MDQNIISLMVSHARRGAARHLQLVLAVRWLRLLLALSQVVDEDAYYDVPVGSVWPR